MFHIQISNLFFILHIIGIILTNILWIYTPLSIPIHIIVIVSWYLNNNKCLISQLEYSLFKKTFMGRGMKFYVSRKQRYILYLNFIFGIIFHRYFIFNHLKLLYFLYLTNGS